MVEVKETSKWWWFDNHNSSRHSPWLQSTLSDLDAKTKAMLKLIEEDADSFAKRAEMYYKKRPELISMVEDFYRAHCLLAERYDKLKSDNGTRSSTALGFPFASSKSNQDKSEFAYDSHSEGNFDTEDYAESEVEDPEHDSKSTRARKELEEAKYSRNDDECHDDIEMSEDEVLGSSEVHNDETAELREEVERLREENKAQKEELMQKDEEKREVIRQLCLAVDMLKDENSKLRMHISNESPKKGSTFEFMKLEWLLVKLFNGSRKTPPGVISLNQAR